VDPLALLIVAAFLGGFTQGVAGFGFGLVTMAVMPLVLDVREAVPLVSLMGLAVGSLVLARWHRHFSWRLALPILVGGVVGVPLGVAFLANVDERPLTGVLGAVLVAYSIWSLVRERGSSAPADLEPRRVAPGWGVLAGALGGVIGGAFNTGGPPLVLYASACRWRQGTFIGVLQGSFLAMTCLQFVLLVKDGLVTVETLAFGSFGIPALALGTFVGGRLSSRLDPRVFRNVVYVLLLVLGTRFLLRAI